MHLYKKTKKTNKSQQKTKQRGRNRHNTTQPSNHSPFGINLSKRSRTPTALLFASLVCNLTSFMACKQSFHTFCWYISRAPIVATNRFIAVLHQNKQHKHQKYYPKSATSPTKPQTTPPKQQCTYIVSNFFLSSAASSIISCPSSCLIISFFSFTLNNNCGSPSFFFTMYFNTICT